MGLQLIEHRLNNLTVGKTENDPLARDGQLGDSSHSASSLTNEGGQTSGVDIEAHNIEAAREETFRHRAAHQAQANQPDRLAIEILCRRNNRRSLLTAG